MNMKKRGLSDVVAVTLIILLAIAAVVIVWAFVKNMLTTTGEEIEANCLKVDVKPISCTNASNVVVQNGPGDITLSSVRIIVYDTATGASRISTGMTGCANIAPLQSAQCTSVVPALEVGNSVSVAGVITKDGKDNVCNPSSEKVICTAQI